MSLANLLRGWQIPYQIPSSDGLGWNFHRFLNYLPNEGFLTANQYRDYIFEPIVHPRAAQIRKNFVLMHDNARQHAARTVNPLTWISLITFAICWRYVFSIKNWWQEKSCQIPCKSNGNKLTKTTLIICQTDFELSLTTEVVIYSIRKNLNLHFWFV